MGGDLNAMKRVFSNRNLYIGSGTSESYVQEKVENCVHKPDCFAIGSQRDESHRFITKFATAISNASLEILFGCGGDELRYAVCPEATVFGNEG